MAGRKRNVGNMAGRKKAGKENIVSLGERSMNIHMKKRKKQIGKLLAAWILFAVLISMGPYAMTAEAAQEGGAAQKAEAAQENGMVMKAEKAIAMKATPGKSAETLMTFEKDSLIFVTDETENGWYHVKYQDMEGYVEKSGLVVQEIDIAGLDAEMAANEAETKFVIEVVEKYRADARRSKIWGTVIILLVAGIFGVGIFSAVRSNKSDGEEDGGGNAKETRKSDFKEKGPEIGKKDSHGSGKHGLGTRKNQELKIENLD